MQDIENKFSSGDDNRFSTGSVSELLESFIYPVCIISVSGELLNQNRQFENVFNSDLQSAQLDWTHPFYPEYRKRLALAYLRAIKGQARQCFAVMKSVENERIPVELYLFPLTEGDVVKGILVLLKIVEDRIFSFNKSTTVLINDEEVDYESNVFEFSPFPIVRINQKGEIIKASSSLQGFLGYTTTSLMKNRNLLFKTLGRYDFERMRKAMFDLFSGIASFKRIGEVKIIPKGKEDVTEKWANLICYPIVAQKEVLAVEVIIEDLTRVKQLEQSMSSSNRIQIVGDLTRGFLHFFNNVINIIMSRTQLLLQMTEKESVLDGLRMIEHAAQDGMQQVRRIEDFIGEGDRLYEKETANLVELVEDALEFAKIQFKVDEKERRRKIVIERLYFSLVYVNCDVRLVREVLLSVLFRVSSYIDKSGTVKIELKKNSGVTINVSVDKLAGGEKSVQDKLSNLFISAVDVRKLAEEINLKIIEEESSSAYSIKIMFPSDMIVPDDQDKNENIGFKIRDLDILVVEDEAALQEILFELFDSMGNRVVLAKSAEDAIDELKKHPFDVVISDYGLPGITGLELLARVKEQYENTVTVLLTGWMLTDLKAYKNVVDLYLPKPFKLDVLIRELSCIFNNLRST
ncbi:MAG TPA: response regulator [Spirochaetota bacterium]|nr:response regulator [Spirochaetota bacterium]